MTTQPRPLVKGIPMTFWPGRILALFVALIAVAIVAIGVGVAVFSLFDVRDTQTFVITLFSVFFGGLTLIACVRAFMPPRSK
jgi:hypothetical protein